jgi:hypothetical protein
MIKIVVGVFLLSHSKVFLQQNPTCTWNYTVEVTIRQQEDVLLNVFSLTSYIIVNFKEQNFFD